MLNLRFCQRKMKSLINLFPVGTFFLDKESGKDEGMMRWRVDRRLSFSKLSCLEFGIQRN